MSVSSLENPGRSPTEAVRRRRGIVWGLAALWLAYVAVRILVIPADGSVALGFSHDSAYISIVAERVRDGKGFTNPGNWLLFLNPSRLPMPYHNANPGYPALNAVISGIFGVDVVRAGLLVSAMSSAALAAIVFWVVNRFSRKVLFSGLCGAAVVVFPPIWRTSFRALPDMLCTVLCLAVIAVIVRSRSVWWWFGAGVLFGSAWLVRSTAVFILPGLIWWVVRTERWQHILRPTSAFVVGSILAASPWLIHTQETWGSPFRSDAMFSMLQDFHARQYGGDISKYHRTLTEPPTLGSILAHQPGTFVMFVAGRTPLLFSRIAGGFSEREYAAAAAILALLTLASVHSVRAKIWRTPEFQAGFLIVAATTLSLLPLAQSYEARYYNVATVFLILWAMIPVQELFGGATGARPGLLAKLMAAGLTIYVAVFVIVQDRDIFDSLTSASPFLTSYRTMSLEIARKFPNAQAVVLDDPYFFTFYTKRSGIAPPYATKQELLDFMSRYSARLLLLSTSDLDYYYPGAPDILRPEIRVDRQLGSYTLFQRTD